MKHVCPLVDDTSNTAGSTASAVAHAISMITTPESPARIPIGPSAPCAYPTTLRRYREKYVGGATGSTFSAAYTSR